MAAAHGNNYLMLLGLLSPVQQQALKKVSERLLEDPTGLDNRTVVKKEEKNERPPHVR